VTTNASIASKPPKSSGLTPSLNDALYAARAAGRPVDHLVVVGLLNLAGHTELNGNQSVKLEWVRLEILRAGADATNVREIIAQSWEHRHSLMPLPMDFASQPEEDQARFLLTVIDERATELGLTETEVGAAWREHFGIDPDAKDKDTPAGWARPDYKRANPHHLREFALAWGALADEVPGDDEPLPDDVADTPDDNGEDEPQEATG
jgi:hypothetical protein